MKTRALDRRAFESDSIHLFDLALTRQYPASIRKIPMPQENATRISRFLRSIALGAVLFRVSLLASAESGVDRFLYVACPGLRNYLEYGGQGLLVFDIDDDYRFVKRIPLGGLDEKGRPLNVKGVCANAATGRIYITTLRTMMCVDLVTEKLLWERSYEGGCDRQAISPDGATIYLPSLEKDHWHVVDGRNGDIIKRIDIQAGAHNTVYGLDGKEAYLAGLKSPWLRVADTATHSISKEIGPFSDMIRREPSSDPGIRQCQQSPRVRDWRFENRENAAPRRSTGFQNRAR
jgi:hypothetical protein